jgi:large subunit ribosomal protein L32e
MTELKARRRQLKKRKPEFKRHETCKRKMLSDSWRRPKGDKNSRRTRQSGRAKRVSIGYGTPKEVRGLNRLGLRETRACNPQEVRKLNPKTDMLIISGTVGRKKRLDMLKAAEEMKLKVGN